MKKKLRVVQPQKRRNDPDKTDWVRLGIGWSDSKGTRIKLNALPLPDENGEVWISLFEDDGSGGGQKQDQSSPQNSSGGMNDEIPF
jgi:hypothetical protein